MAETINNIAALRKMRKLSQQQLATLVGAHVITISNLERGRAPLTLDWIERLAWVLRVDEDALFKAERPTRVYVGAEITSNRLTIYDVGDGPPDIEPVVAYAKAPSPDHPADMHRWIVVRDNSLYPVFQELDVIRAVVVLRNDPQEWAWAKRRLCIVGAAADEVIHIGYLSQESISEHVTVNTITGPPVAVYQPKFLWVVDRAIFQPEFPDRG